MRSLPTRFKVDLKVKPGSHNSDNAGQLLRAPYDIVILNPVIGIVNKQLNDKERVAAALENPALVEALETCLASASRRGQQVDTTTL